MMYRHLLDLIPAMTQKIESDSFWKKGFPGQDSLVQWLKDDFRSGNLSLVELEGIFAHDNTETEEEVSYALPSPVEGLSSMKQLLAAFSFDQNFEPRLEVKNAGSTSDTDLPPLLRVVNADNVAERLCGPFQQQVSNELWLRRSESLTSWLRRPSKVPQIRKDFVLICIYVLRAKRFEGSFLHKSQFGGGILTDPIRNWKLFRECIQRYRDCIATFDASHPNLLQAFPGAIEYKMGFKAQIADAFLMFVYSVWLIDLERDIENTFSSVEIIALNDEVIKISRELICFYGGQGSQEMLGKSQARLATLLLLKIHMNITESPNDLLAWREEGLRLLAQADDVFASKLRRHRGATIIESLWSKEDSRSFRAAHFLPETALNFLQLPDAFKHQDHSRIWEWVQRAKAKALHSVMNWRDEQSSGGGNLNQNDLSSFITATMEKEVERPISFADLDRMAKMSGIDNVTFVDWFSLPRFPGRTFGQIFMIIVKPGLETIVKDLGMTDEGILQWKGTRFNREENMFQGGRDLEDAMSEPRDKSPLHDLKPLVVPLLEHTDPGSLLVFCPSNFLHQLPLHALELPDGTVFDPSKPNRLLLQSLCPEK
jgi:hypothetical protein